MHAAAGPSLSDPSQTPDQPSDQSTNPSSSPVRRRLLALVGVLTLAVLAVDQASKALAVDRLDPERPVRLVGDLLRLQLIGNAGVAFSVANRQTWLVTVVAVVIVAVVVGVLVRNARRLASRGWAVAFALLLGGAAGNLVDRFARDPGLGRGRVVDFIAYDHLFIGNVADIAIVAAAVAMALLSLRGTGLDGRRPGQHRQPADVAGDVPADVPSDVPTDVPADRAQDDGRA